MAPDPGRQPHAGDFLARLRAALCGPDLSAAAGLLSPGVTYRHHGSLAAPDSGSEGLPAGATCRGRAPVLGWLHTVTAEGLRFLLVETTVAPPHVLLVVRLGDGARRDQLLVFVVAVDGGVITEIREFPDRRTAMVHARLAPAAPDVPAIVSTGPAGAFRFAGAWSAGRRAGSLGVTTVPAGARMAREA